MNIGPLQQTTLTDSNGYWQFSLIPNPLLTPTGTSYTIETPYNSYSISVPNSAGPFQSSSILVNVPSVISPAVTNLTGPITVTGNETVTGTLTVSGTSTLDGTTTGALTATANSGINGDLTIFSPGRLLFTALASKIVPGATSISHRNNADSADNLLITDAGAVTIRSSLAVGSGGLTVSGGGASIVGNLGLTSGVASVPSAGLEMALGSVVGAPTIGTFATGQLFTDSKGALWNCTSGGTPGTWVFVGGGSYHAEVFQSTNQSGLTAGNPNLINYDTVLSDPLSGYTTGRYTVPVVGRWRVSALVSVASVADTVASFASVYRNGSEYARLNDATSGASGNKGQGGSTVVRCTSTADFLQVIWFPASGGPYTLNGGQALNWATFEYLGTNS